MLRYFDEMIPMHKQIYHNLDIAKNVNLNIKKVPEVIKKVLASAYMVRLCRIMTLHRFSVIIDVSYRALVFA